MSTFMRPSMTTAMPPDDMTTSNPKTVRPMMPSPASSAPPVSAITPPSYSSPQGGPVPPAAPQVIPPQVTPQAVNAAARPYESTLGYDSAARAAYGALSDARTNPAIQGPIQDAADMAQRMAVSRGMTANPQAFSAPGRATPGNVAGVAGGGYWQAPTNGQSYASNMGVSPEAIASARGTTGLTGNANSYGGPPSSSYVPPNPVMSTGAAMGVLSAQEHGEMPSQSLGPTPAPLSDDQRAAIQQRIAGNNAGYDAQQNHDLALAHENARFTNLSPAAQATELNNREYQIRMAFAQKGVPYGMDPLKAAEMQQFQGRAAAGNASAAHSQAETQRLQEQQNNPQVKPGKPGFDSNGNQLFTPIEQAPTGTWEHATALAQEKFNPKPGSPEKGTDGKPLTWDNMPPDQQLKRIQHEARLNHFIVPQTYTGPAPTAKGETTPGVTQFTQPGATGQNPPAQSYAPVIETEIQRWIKQGKTRDQVVDAMKAKGIIR